VAAAILAGRRYPGPASSGPPLRTKAGQGFAAGLLASLSGALIVTVLGMGTIALMLHATWLRILFDHGHHLNAVVVYSHEIDAATNAQGYLSMCVAFPIIGLFMSMIGAGCVSENSSAAGQGGPPRGGGPGQPGPAPVQPDGGRRVEADGGVGKLTADPFPAQAAMTTRPLDPVAVAAGGPATQSLRTARSWDGGAPAVSPAPPRRRPRAGRGRSWR
jgi:hypothetical protein